jgi:hypothetical protein
MTSYPTVCLEKAAWRSEDAGTGFGDKKASIAKKYHHPRSVWGQINVPRGPRFENLNRCNSERNVIGHFGFDGSTQGAGVGVLGELPGRVKVAVHARATAPGKWK